MLKVFLSKDTNQSVAINPSNVRLVHEMTNGIGPKIIFNDGSYVVTKESYSEVVTRLNEKTK
jgi:hypothetical protein